MSSSFTGTLTILNCSITNAFGFIEHHNTCFMLHCDDFCSEPHSAHAFLPSSITRTLHDEMLFVLYPDSCSAPEPCSSRHQCHLGEQMVEKTTNNIQRAFMLRLLRCLGWRRLATAKKSYFDDIVELFGLVTCGTRGRRCHGSIKCRNET